MGFVVATNLMVSCVLCELKCGIAGLIAGWFLSVFRVEVSRGRTKLIDCVEGSGPRWWCW